MSLAFPLPLADFWDQLPIASLSLAPVEQVESSGVASGQILTREVAPAQWRGAVTLGRLTSAEAADIVPLIDLAQRPGTSFLACDLTRPWPALDADGAVLGAAAVTVNSISANRRELKLSGLPAWYQLRRGDLVGVQWGASPVRYGLHRIAVAASADATGLTGWNEVTPALPAALVAGAVATLARPAIKAVVMPGSVQPGTRRGGMVEGIAFSFVQTLR
jgi:hypothetical protein